MTAMTLLVGLLAGAGGQLIDAAAGAGFGAFSTTILLAGGIPPAGVVAGVNLAKVGAGLASGLSHWRLGNVRREWLLPLAGSGVAGGLLGVLLLTVVPNALLRLGLPVLLIGLGALVMARFLWQWRRRSPARAATKQAILPGLAPAAPGHVSRRRVGLIGFAAGLTSGLAGSFGPVATPFLALSQTGSPRYAIGTVNLAECLVAATVSTALLVRLSGQGLPWAITLALIAGSLITAPLGAYLTRRLPPVLIGMALGLCLMALNLWSLLQRLL